MPGVTKPIYLDNGATSFPKPPEVPEAINRFIRRIGGSPGRSGHRLSQEAARVVFGCREALAELFGAPDSRRIVFTLNATQALNLALHGLLRPGDRVVTTALEHNSVMRPLRHLERAGIITIEVVPWDGAGHFDLERLEQALRSRTKLLVAVHASNVTGDILPLRAAEKLAHDAGTLLLLDAAQSAGALPIDVLADGIDLLAFTGHKALFGPQGTGGLWVREGIDLEPLFRGGTGSNSELEEQPDFYPDRLESGTPNAVGLAGLLAGVDFLRKTGIPTIQRREEKITRRLLAGLGGVPGLKIYGPDRRAARTPVISATFDGLVPSEAGFLLEEGFGILTRVGLHCAPAAHRAIGTYPHGTVRFTPGFFTTEAEVDRTIAACRHLADKKRKK